MAACIMRIIGLTTLRNGEKYIDTAHPQAGRYVREYSASGHGGRGVLHTTDDRHQAQTWPSGEIALRAWRTVSVTHPVRPDGEPNRPLTAFTIELLPAPARERAL